MRRPPSDEKIAVITGLLMRLRWLKGFPDSEEAIRMVARSVARFASTSLKKHEILFPDGREVVPAEWLMDEIADCCEWFPAPIQIRALYNSYWKCEDGREPDEMKDTLTSNG
jgi:hypothetical protein